MRIPDNDGGGKLEVIMTLRWAGETLNVDLGVGIKYGSTHGPASHSNSLYRPHKITILFIIQDSYTPLLQPPQHKQAPLIL